jgi:hypothetical protein
VAELVTAVQQRLREVARNRGGDDLWRDEQADAEEVGTSSMKRSGLGFAIAKLPLEAAFSEVRGKKQSRGPYSLTGAPVLLYS